MGPVSDKDMHEDHACAVHVGPHSFLVLHRTLAGKAERLNVMGDVYTSSLLQSHISTWKKALLTDPKLKVLASLAGTSKHRLTKRTGFAWGLDSTQSSIQNQYRDSPASVDSLEGSLVRGLAAKSGASQLTLDSLDEPLSRSSAIPVQQPIGAPVHQMMHSAPTSSCPPGNHLFGNSSETPLCVSPDTIRSLAAAVEAASKQEAHTAVACPVNACLPSASIPTCFPALSSHYNQGGIDAPTIGSESIGLLNAALQQFSGLAPSSTDDLESHSTLTLKNSAQGQLPALAEKLNGAVELNLDHVPDAVTSLDTTATCLPALTGVTAEIVDLITSRLTDVMTSTHHKVPSALIRDVSMHCVD